MWSEALGLTGAGTGKESGNSLGMAELATGIPHRPVPARGSTLGAQSVFSLAGNAFLLGHQPCTLLLSMAATTLHYFCDNCLKTVYSVLTLAQDLRDI